MRDMTITLSGWDVASFLALFAILLVACCALSFYEGRKEG